MTIVNQDRTASPTVKELRHKAEVPTLALAAALTAIGAIAAAAAAASGASVPAWASAAAIGLSFPIMMALVFIRYMYWKQIANSVEITNNQLPEIYSAYCEMADRMELDTLPRLYLANGNGALNAFAAKCQVRRSYVVIFSDLVDIAYEHGDFEGVNFVLAHELGHIKCGHVDLWRQGILALPRIIFFGRTVTRAQEYTADRCAAYYAPEGAKSMMALYAGKRMYRHCDLSAHLDSIDQHKNGFWLKISNVLSGHAVGFRRMEPLANLEETGWDTHGRMI